MAAFFYSDGCPFSPGMAVNVVALEAMFPSLQIVWVPIREADTALLTFGVLELPSFVILKRGGVAHTAAGIRYGSCSPFECRARLSSPPPPLPSPLLSIPPTQFPGISCAAGRQGGSRGARA